MSPSETVAEFMKAIERKDVDAAVAFTSAHISYENMPTDGKIELWRDYFDMGTYQRQFAELTGK